AHRDGIVAVRILRLLAGVGLGDIPDVFAVVPALGNLRGTSLELLDACLNGKPEVGDLGARIVVVKLPGHLPAGPLEQGGNRVPDSRLASMADVQRAGGVGRNEFHVDRPVVSHRAPAVSRSSGKNG